MPTDLASTAAELSPVDRHILDGLFRARATATARAYWREWVDFSDWCRRHGQEAVPASEATIVDYLTEISSTLALSSIHRKLAAIACAHALCDTDSPTKKPLVRETVSRMRRRAGRERLRKAGLTPEDIARIASALPRTLQGDRDRCLILLGYATSLRRSDLASLHKSDIYEVENGIAIRLHRGSDEREGGPSITVPRHTQPALCAVSAYRKWIDSSKIDHGPVFRWVTRHGQVRRDGLSDKAVAMIVKRAVALVGKDPSHFAANSLRRPE